MFDKLIDFEFCKFMDVTKFPRTAWIASIKI